MKLCYYLLILEWTFLKCPEKRHFSYRGCIIRKNKFTVGCIKVNMIHFTKSLAKEQNKKRKYRFRIPSTATFVMDDINILRFLSSCHIRLVLLKQFHKKLDNYGQKITLSRAKNTYTKRNMTHFN